jgi:glycosyltransferase involved in cell wall biosynthesis
MVNSLVIIGPAWPLRGGLAAFDEQLAKGFNLTNVKTRIETFSLQYPSLLFPGTSQYTDQPAPSNLKINAGINSINPINWIMVGLRIKKEQPDLIIVRYWIPFMAPCLGTICRIIKSNKHTKIICIVDNMIPHEKRFADKLLSSFFVKSVHAFLTMSEKVANDVTTFSKSPLLISPHPIFEHFGKIIAKSDARTQLGIAQEEKVILFFGFIRQYKGLDLLLNAMSNPMIHDAKIKLWVVGEFYEDAKPYHDLIEKLDLQERVTLHNEFVPDNEVSKYVGAADFIIQPYRNATQSGVTPLAYYFEKPMLVTNVGALADTVPDGKVGFVVEPNSESIATGILKLYELGVDYFHSNLQIEKRKYSWETMINNFIKLFNQIKK